MGPGCGVARSGSCSRRSTSSTSSPPSRTSSSRAAGRDVPAGGTAPCDRAARPPGCGRPGPDTFPTGSGGERQRVALARALVNEPLVVLADELTGNLDSQATNEILQLFGELRDTGQTLVLVTHDARVAATAERLLSMRDGAIVEDTRLDGGLPRQTFSPSWPDGRRRWGPDVWWSGWHGGTCAPAMAGAAVAARPERGHHHHHAGDGARRRQRPPGTGSRKPPTASTSTRAEISPTCRLPSASRCVPSWPASATRRGDRRRWPVAKRAGRRRDRRRAAPPQGAGPRHRPGRGRPAPGDRRALVGRPEGVVLEDGFATAAGLQPGDTITIAGQRAKRCAALTVDVGHCTHGSAGRVDQPGHRRPARHGPRRGRIFARAAAGGPGPGRVARRRPPGGQRHLAGEPGRDRHGHPGAGRRLRHPGHLRRRAHHRHRRHPGRRADGRSDPSGRHAQSRGCHARPGHLRPARRVPRRGVLATAVGLAAGTCWRRLARVSRPCCPCTAPRPHRSPGHAATAFAVTTAVVVLATVRPALRGVRRSTLRSLASNTRPPHRPGRLVGRSPGCRSPCRYGWACASQPARQVPRQHVGVDRRHHPDDHRPRVAHRRRRRPPASCPSTNPTRSPRRRHRDPDASGLGFTVAAFLIALALINATVAAVRRPRPRPQPRHHAHDRHHPARPSRRSSSPS